jgi:lysophospholipase L1-like esterase
MILCYGDSNLRGFIPGSYEARTGLSQRYSKEKRWTGVAQHKLGANYNVIEEGLNGRTTALDEIDPGRGYRNGLTHLPMYLESHFPIDLVIFMLGANDCKTQFRQTAENIAAGMRKLIRVVQTSHRGPQGKAPKILVIACPPMLKSVTVHDPFFGEDSVKTSEQLPSFYKHLASEEKCEFLDASLLIKSSEVDGVHFDEEQVQILGDAVAKKVLQIF